MFAKTTAALAVLVLALAACAQDGAQSPTTDAATTDAAATDAGTPGATDGDVAMSCEEAFAQVDPDDAAEAIEQSGDALDDTIAACDSVEEWLEHAGDAFGVTEEEGREFVGARCRTNPELAHLNACADPTSS